jgi:ethanolamine utilization protein EutQ (cupin superfamily)
MEALQNNVKCIYYKNLETYAKKHKIEIDLPEYKKMKDTSPIEDNTNTDINTDINTEPNTETEGLYSEDFVYKKPWNKMNIIHKKLKMEEFVNTLSIDDVDIKKHLKTQLVTMLKNKKLTKKNEVEYDATNGRIISIPALKYKNNNYNIDA